jgi:2-keto-4-pentenoate hydratase/2-oxohepta-3-ene-1,7-dioic acid hydratase in catechol pathway
MKAAPVYRSPGSVLVTILIAVSTFSLAGCRMLGFSPPRPTKSIGMAYNLPKADGSPQDQTPSYFVRSATSVSWEDEPIVIPASLERIDYEGELVIVIGRRASRVPLEEAASHILGYTCGMDGTPQVYGADGQRDVLRSLAGKSADGIAPVGPRIVPALDPAGHEIILRVNAQVVERAHTKDFQWDPARIVSELSRTVTLEPGDVIFSGARQAIPQLRDGDVVEVEIPGIGLLSRRVLAER